MDVGTPDLTYASDNIAERLPQRAVHEKGET